MKSPSGTVPVILPILLVVAGILVAAPFPAYAIWKLTENYPKWKRVAAFLAVVAFVVFWTFQAANSGWRKYPVRI